MPRMPPHVQRYVVEQMRGDLSGGAVARQRVGAYGDNTRVMDGLLSRNPKINGRLSVAIDRSITFAGGTRAITLLNMASSDIKTPRKYIIGSETIWRIPRCL